MRATLLRVQGNHPLHHPPLQRIRSFSRISAFHRKFGEIFPIPVRPQWGNSSPSCWVPAGVGLTMKPSAVIEEKCPGVGGW